MFARSKRPHDGGRLPLGAEAALWSIVEVIPDPRNHLALTRDPTAEVRLSAAQIEAVAAAPVPAATASSAHAGHLSLVPEPDPDPVPQLDPEPAPTLAQLPPPPAPVPPPPPVPSTSALALPSSVMARMRIAALDWSTNSPEVARLAARSELAPPTRPEPDAADLALLEAALAGDEDASAVAGPDIDLSEPIRIAVQPDTAAPESIPVGHPCVQPDRSGRPIPAVDHQVWELFPSDA